MRNFTSRGTACRAPTRWLAGSAFLPRLLRPLFGFLLLVSFRDRLAQTSSAAPAPAWPKALLEAGDSISLTFGSQAVLESCWSPEELRGAAAEKKAGPAGRAVSPPERKSPLRPRPPLPPALDNSIRSVKPRGEAKLIALTFDLCERERETAGYDAEILEFLRQNRVQATFFAGGKWMQSHRERTLQLMADPLFEIGNHTWTHADLRLLSGRNLEDQVLWTQAEYELFREDLAQRPCVERAGPEEMAKIPAVPLVFRFPYGACRPEALRFLAAQGLPAVQWSIVTGDAAAGQSAAKIAQVILDQARPGAIIVCHANGRGHGTAAALPLFVPELRRRGYEFVTVSALLAAGPAAAASQCYELKPGDTRRYDRRFGGKP